MERTSSGFTRSDNAMEQEKKGKRSPRRPRAACLLSMWLGLFLVSGCIQEVPTTAGNDRPAATPTTPPVGYHRPRQLIIKFRQPDLDPSREEVLTSLSRDAGVRLLYVRPMSGGAHVLRLEQPMDQKGVEAIIDRLSRRLDVEYVEIDVPMFHQPSP